MCNDLRILSKNKNFLLVLISFTLIYSIYGAIGFLINPLLKPLGYGTTQMSSIAMLIVLIGTFAAMTTGIILDRTNKYKLTL